MVAHRFAGLLTAILLLSAVTYAAELSEQAQAQAEEASEAGMGEGEVPVYTGTGKVTFGAANPDVPSVVGLFRTERGAVLQLKVKEPGLVNLLKGCNGKIVTLTGSLRNAGKYLIVHGVVEPEAPPVNRKKKGGF